ncbi:MAG: hypothetical protein AAF798_13970 [Bacteroidota bacterium]
MRLFSLFVVLLCFHSLRAQFELIPLYTAQSTGLGQPSRWEHPANLAFAKLSSVTATASNSFLLPEVQHIGLTGSFAFANAGMRLQVDQVGLADAFRQMRFQVGYGRLLLEDFSLGVQLEAVQIQLFEYGSAWQKNYAIGMQYQLHPSLIMQMQVRNPIPLPQADYLPSASLVQLSLNYQVSSEVDLFTEVEKNVHFPVRLKVGLEYRVLKQVAFRTGMLTGPTQLAFGFGYRFWEHYQLDVATTFHQQLGWSPSLSLGYLFE